MTSSNDLHASSGKAANAMLGLWARIYIARQDVASAVNLMANHPRYDWAGHLTDEERAAVDATKKGGSK